VVSAERRKHVGVSVSVSEVSVITEKRAEIPVSKLEGTKRVMSQR